MCRMNAFESFLSVLENISLSLLRLIFFKQKSLSYWSSNDPYKLFESHSNWPRNGPWNFFFFLRNLKVANCPLLFLLIRKIPSLLSSWGGGAAHALLRPVPVGNSSCLTTSSSYYLWENSSGLAASCSQGGNSSCLTVSSFWEQLTPSCVQFPTLP